MEAVWDSLKVLHQKDDDQYEPDQEEIIEYAEYFGLQFPNDIKFLPLLREGLTARLPQQWQACHTPDGSLVYRNTKTRIIQQEHPLDQYYRQRILEMKEQEMQLSVIPEQPRNQSDAYQLSEKNQFQSSNKQKQSQNYFDKNITQYSQLEDELYDQGKRSQAHKGSSSASSNFINKHIYGMAKEQRLSNPVLDILQKPKYTFSDDIASRNQSPTKFPESALQRAYQRQNKLKRKNKRLQIQNIRMQIKIKKDTLKNLQKQNKNAFNKLRSQLYNNRKHRNPDIKDQSCKSNRKQENNSKSISLKQLDQKMLQLPIERIINLPKAQKINKSRYN